MTFRRAESELLRRAKRLAAPGLLVALVLAGVSLQWSGERAVEAPEGAVTSVQAEGESTGRAADADQLVPDHTDSGVDAQAALITGPASPAHMDQTDAAPASFPPREVARTVAIRRGDTLMEALLRAGAERRDAYQAITAMSPHFDPRKLQIGQELDLTFLETADHAPELIALSLEEAIDRQVSVTRGEGETWLGRVEDKPLQRMTMRAAGRIDSSLFLAADRQNVPPQVIVEMIRIFSFDVDFQRDIRAGDSFEIYFERFATPDGKRVREGEILFAELTMSGKSVALYRYQIPGTDKVDYFHEDGSSARRILMKTPVDGARLSSTFGARRHPILGYTRMHKGLDFAAPRGTPIMAAGDGVVERADWYGGYGRYIRIRHNGTYKTAYAHLNAFARGIRAGARVRQGQVIGYIGTTGRSTGPHLHYEVLMEGKQVNPFTLKLPTGQTLKGDALVAFSTYRGALETEIAAIPLPYDVAELQD